VLAGKLPKEDLHEVMAMLHDSGNNPQVRSCARDAGHAWLFVI